MTGKHLGMYFEFRNFFNDSLFLDKYIAYLEKYTSIDFIENQLDENQSEIDFYETEIRKEYRFYKFDDRFLFENARMIREKLPELIKNKKKMISSQPYKGDKINYKKLSYPPVNDESLIAYISIKNNKARIQLQNFYYKTLIINGYIEGLDTLRLDNQLKIAPLLNTESISTTTINLDYLVEKILYQIEGDDTKYTQKIIPFRAPE
jgi:hypothetical protein